MSNFKINNKLFCLKTKSKVDFASNKNTNLQYNCVYNMSFRFQKCFRQFLGPSYFTLTKGNQQQLILQSLLS